MYHKLQSQINQIFKQQPISVCGFGIYQQDFLSLKDGQWLRSGSISLLVAMIVQRFEEDKKKKQGKMEKMEKIEKKEKMDMEMDMRMEMEKRQLDEKNNYEHSHQHHYDHHSIQANKTQLQQQHKYQNLYRLITQTLSLRPYKIIDPATTAMILFMGQQQYILASLQPLNIFSYRYLLIPCNTDTNQTGKGSHWFLIIYDTVENQMMTMDSAYQCVHTNAKLMGKRLQEMRKMFGVRNKFREFCEKIQGEIGIVAAGEKIGEEFYEKQFKVRWLKNVERQLNSYDCGIYTVANIQKIMTQLQNRQQQQQAQSQQFFQTTHHPSSTAIISQINSLIATTLNKYKIKIDEMQVNKQFSCDRRIKYFSDALEALRKEKIVKEASNKQKEKDNKDSKDSKEKYSKEKDMQMQIEKRKSSGEYEKKNRKSCC